MPIRGVGDFTIRCACGGFIILRLGKRQCQKCGWSGTTADEQTTDKPQTQEKNDYGKQHRIL